MSIRRAGDDLHVNGQRLWDTLMEMAEIGKTPDGGCNRVAATDEDREGQELFIEWASAAGCRVVRDQIGNLYAERAGRDPSRPQVVVGSHLDTVYNGGKFDGPVGVLIGLEIVRTLNEREITTEAPLVIVSWANEEGARFPQPTTGSGVFAGLLTLEEALAQRALDGPTLGDELARLGLLGDEKVGSRRIGALFEAHIEQNRQLESSGSVIGIVAQGQGLCAIQVTLKGESSHVGTTVMRGRRDALLAAARIVEFARELANEVEEARSTVGYLSVAPNVRNLIPGRVEMIVDVRHVDQDVLDDLERRTYDTVHRVAEETLVDVELSTFLRVDPVAFDTACNELIRDAAAELGHPALELTSGAVHDATYMTRVAPTALMFIPCRDGVTHDPREYATPEHVQAGCNVMLRAVLRRAA